MAQDLSYSVRAGLDLLPTSSGPHSRTQNPSASGERIQVSRPGDTGSGGRQGEGEAQQGLAEEYAGGQCNKCPHCGKPVTVTCMPLSLSVAVSISVSKSVSASVSMPVSVPVSACPCVHPRTPPLCLRSPSGAFVQDFAHDYLIANPYPLCKAGQATILQKACMYAQMLSAGAQG